MLGQTLFAPWRQMEYLRIVHHWQNMVGNFHIGFPRGPIWCCFFIFRSLGRQYYNILKCWNVTTKITLKKKVELNQMKHTLLGRAGFVAGASSSGTSEKGGSLEQRRGHRETQLPVVWWASVDHTQVSAGIPRVQCQGWGITIVPALKLPPNST